MSNSSQRTKSSSRHLNVASEVSTSPRRQTRSSSSSLPFNLPRETRSSTRRQTNSCTNRETRPFTRRQLLPRERRSRRAQIVHENRAARNIAHSDVNLVQQHFNRMRNRPERMPSNNGMSDDEDPDGEETPHGIQEFNSAVASFPSTPYMYNYPNLHHEVNNVCPHCNTMLWNKERKHRLNCCNNGRYTIPASKPVPPELMNTFTSKEFQRVQRGYKDLFSFTAFGAGGVDKRSWTQPNRGSSILTLHSQAYHRIFDLQQQYEDMNVSNSSRIYIFDSEFAETCSRKLNTDIVDTLRTHIHDIVRLAQDHRSAVDSVLNSPVVNDPNSPTPYIEFADKPTVRMMVDGK